jgi:hypothetical protein
VPHIPDDISDAVRRAYSAPVDDGVRERHVAAIAAAAREPDTVTVSARRHGRRRVGTALAAGLALFAAPAGLAVAGVALPEPARAPFDAVGIELPNQDPEKTDKTEPPRRATPARTTADPAPARTTPPAAATDDEQPGTRRSEERNKGRRGDEASDGRRQGGENRSGAAGRERTAKPRPVKPAKPVTPPRGRSDEAPGRTTPKAVTPRRPDVAPDPKPKPRVKPPSARTTPVPAPNGPGTRRGKTPKLEEDAPTG